LRIVAQARNLIVHTRTTPDAYVVAPSHSLVASVEAVRDRLLKPRSALRAFGKCVRTMKAGDPLSAVFTAIAQADYSQFPVYRDGMFVGLLTENGITRWIARRARRDDADWDQVPVGEVFRSEDGKGRNYAFVGANNSVLDIRAQFWANELLEAALITRRGSPSNRLLGIATRWDIAAWRED